MESTDPSRRSFLKVMGVGAGATAFGVSGDATAGQDNLGASPMRYNTGNPVGTDGSSDPRDLYDNAGIIDVWVNDRTKISAPDRLGNDRKTLWGLEQQVNYYLENQGFEPVPLNYVDGSQLLVSRPTQLIQRGDNLYSVKLPASFPVTLTGTWASDQAKLVTQVDSSLRDQLVSTAGGGMIGTLTGQTVESRLTDIFHGDVRAYGVFPGVTSSQVAKFTGTLPSTLVFPAGRYYLGGITMGLFSGVTFAPLGDGQVTIAINGLSDAIEFQALDGVDIVYQSTSRKFSRGRAKGMAAQNALKVFSETPADWSVNKANTRSSFAATIDSTTGAIVEGAAITPATNGRILLAATGAGKFGGAFARIRPHDVLTAYIDSTTVVKGIAVVGDTYTAVIYASPSDRINYTFLLYQGGAIVQQRTLDVIDPNNPAYNSANCSMSIDVVTGNTFAPLINGARIGEEINVGPIQYAGFVVRDTAATTNMHGIHFDAYRYARGLKPLSSVCIYGDSTAAPLSYSWDKHLPAAMMALGSYAPPILNRAIGGYAMGQVYTDMLANGFGSANVVIVMAGTNDIQAGLSEGSIRTGAQQIIDYVISQNRRLIWIEPYIWYPQQSDGIGVVTTNAQAGARARLQIKDAVLASGGTWVPTTHLMPAPLTVLLGSGVDTLLRDNIHQTESLNMGYAGLVAQALVKCYSAKASSHSWPIGRLTFASGLVTSSTVVVRTDADGSVTAKGVITLTTTSGEILADLKGAITGPYYQATIMRGGNTALACFLVRNGAGQYNVRGATFVAGDQVIIDLSERS